jgi:anti-sigma regulatory factor (Ser/Thr protein kinase)
MEVGPTHRVVAVTEPSQPSAARYAARDAADRAGFGDEDAYRSGLVATELATNLVKHATGGELLICGLRGAPNGEVEIIAIDRGPGMANVARSLSDGFSTSGTAGNGLGAVRRLADDFDIHSQPGKGTVVLTRLRTGRASHRPSGVVDIAAVSVAKNGEAVCGDAWQVYHHAQSGLALVADGLGHGVLAAEASAAAIGVIDPRRQIKLAESLQAMHTGLRHTRGAAVGIVEIAPHLRVMKFAGVGNVAAAISTVGATRHAVSLNGTLGHEVRQFREYSYPWEPEAILVMHSDGLGSHWSVDAYAGLRHRHPSIVAAVLYRDFNRQRDDVTILIGREAKSSQ